MGTGGSREHVARRSIAASAWLVASCGGATQHADRASTATPDAWRVLPPMSEESGPVVDEDGPKLDGAPRGFALAVMSENEATASDAEPVVTTMRAHFINVGQGDATLLEFPCGTVLVDSGGESPNQFPSVDALTEYLESFFAARPHLNRTLDVVVITHAHLDHTRGIAAILDEGYGIRTVVTNGAETGSGGSQQRRLHETADLAEEILRIALDVGAIPDEGLTDDILDPIACDEVDPELRYFWGAILEGAEGTTSGLGNQNNHSVVLRVVFGEFSLLLTGDLEEEGIQRLLDRSSEHLDVDVYQVGHHGSHNGTTAELVEAMTPEAAVISMGDVTTLGTFSANSFGHPRLETILMLEDGIHRRRSQPIDVLVGLRGRRDDDPPLGNFTGRTIRDAIYATGWDGNVVVTGRSDGQFWLQRNAD